MLRLRFTIVLGVGGLFLQLMGEGGNVMWTRIISNHQLREVSAGTLLIKYPGAGEASNSLNIDDKERLSVRYVIKNFPSAEEFDISLIPYHIEHFLFMMSGLNNLSFASLHKKYTDIVSEGNYWIFHM